MKNVKDTLHLQERNAIWHYYRRVPSHLVSSVGKRFIKRSLRTKSRSEAKQLRTIEDLKTDALFAAAEAIHASPATKSSSLPLPLPPMSLSMLTEHIRATVERYDKRSAHNLLADPPADGEELAEMCRDAEYEIGILSDPDDPRQREQVAKFRERVLVGPKGQIGAGTADSQFNAIVRRGLLELATRRLGRYHDQYDRPFFDEMFNPASPPTISFGELITIYLSEKQESFDLNDVNRKRFDKLVATAGVFCEIVGAGTSVSAIDDEVIQRTRSLLSRMPTNRSKRYPKLSLEQAIARAAKSKSPPLSPVTQGFYLEILRGILDVAVRKKLLPHNPALDARPLKKEAISSDQKRLPWTSEQLKSFFTGKFYSSCAPDSSAPYKRPDRAWRFWMPLMMVFMGLRPNEIAQLHVSDLKQTALGVTYLDISDDQVEGGSKSLKTETSRRRVPLHPELVRIGFLEFVRERLALKKTNGRFLFYELKPDKYGNRYSYASKRFNESFIPAEMKLGERQALYSLRHNVRDALRRIEATDDALLAIAGWAPGKKSVSDHYGDPGNPDLYSKWVAKIGYDGLDLSFLYT